MTFFLGLLHKPEALLQSRSDLVKSEKEQIGTSTGKDHEKNLNAIRWSVKAGLGPGEQHRFLPIMSLIMVPVFMRSQPPSDFEILPSP